MAERRKMPPIGVEDFEKLIRNGFYFVDKTMMIADLLRNRADVSLFTRPRRFGKSLNMSMLKCFFEIGSDASIFDGLSISSETELCEEYMGKYPVVSLTLKDAEGDDFQSACRRIAVRVSMEAGRFEFLRTSERLSAREKTLYDKLTDRSMELNTICSSLLDLSSLLEKHYGQKVILMIDEYDVPLQKAYSKGYYDEMAGLIRSMFSQALKTNASLQFAVLTGCLRVSRESIFTGMNNMCVLTASDPRFDGYFGFTDAEVRGMLEYYGLFGAYGDVKEWYDGYCFGNEQMYCPWDVINYVSLLNADPGSAPENFWVNTSSNDAVRRLIDEATDSSMRMDLEDLIAGRAVTKRINEQLTYRELDQRADNIWSLLYMTGYLTTVRRPQGKMYELRIPNAEVREIFTDQVLAWLDARAKTDTGRLTGLYAAFEKGDTDAITDYLNGQLLDTISFYDAHESFYHGFLLALLNSCADWRVSSNKETGKGRSDIIVERGDRRLGFVVEVKNVRYEKELDAACEAAMRQIDEKDYTAPLRRYRVREIWKYGIAFWEKECRVVARRMPY